MNEPIIYWLKLTVYNTTLSSVTIEYFATKGIVIDGVFYEPRILNPGSFKSMMFSDGKTGGASTLSFGEVTLINNDGGLDYLRDYGYGREFEIGKLENGINISQLKGITEQPTFTTEEISIRIKDRSAELNVPICLNRYLGNNSLPNGLEGSSDLKDKPKIRSFGSAPNVTLQCVNSARLIYHGNDGGCSFTNVYDNAVALAKGADYTSQADMEANAPSAGYYRQWVAGGYCRLGSAPSGTVTGNIVTGATIANRTIAQTIKTLVSEKILFDDITESSITKLDIDMPYEIGFCTGVSEMTYLQVFDQICKPDVWFGFDSNNKFWVKQIKTPLVNQIIGLLDKTRILSFDRQATNDDGRGVPYYKVNINYNKNHTVQSDGIAGSVTTSRRDFLKNEFRTISSEDVSIQAIHPLAPVLNIDTLLTTESDAVVEAARILSMRSVVSDLINIKTKSFLYKFSLGDIICIKYPRYGYNAGRAVLIVGMEIFYATNEITYTVWGTSASVALYFSEDYCLEDYCLNNNLDSALFVGLYSSEDYYSEDYNIFI